MISLKARQAAYAMCRNDSSWISVSMASEFQLKANWPRPQVSCPRTRGSWCQRPLAASGCRLSSSQSPPGIPSASPEQIVGIYVTTLNALLSILLNREGIKATARKTQIKLKWQTGPSHLRVLCDARRWCPDRGLTRSKQLGAPSRTFLENK